MLPALAFLTGLSCGVVLCLLCLKGSCSLRRLLSPLLRLRLSPLFTGLPWLAWVTGAPPRPPPPPPPPPPPWIRKHFVTQVSGSLLRRAKNPVVVVLVNSSASASGLSPGYPAGFRCVTPCDPGRLGWSAEMSVTACRLHQRLPPKTECTLSFARPPAASFTYSTASVISKLVPDRGRSSHVLQSSRIRFLRTVVPRQNPFHHFLQDLSERRKLSY